MDIIVSRNGTFTCCACISCGHRDERETRTIEEVDAFVLEFLHHHRAPNDSVGDVRNASKNISPDNYHLTKEGGQYPRGGQAESLSSKLVKK